MIRHQRMSRMAASLGGRAPDPEAGAFIGFTTDPDSSDDDCYDPPLLLQGMRVTQTKKGLE